MLYKCTVNWNSCTDAIDSPRFDLFLSDHQHHKKATASPASSLGSCKVHWTTSIEEPHESSFQRSPSSWNARHLTFTCLHLKKRWFPSSNREWQTAQRVSSSTPRLATHIHTERMWVQAEPPQEMVNFWLTVKTPKSHPNPWFPPFFLSRRRRRPILPQCTL